MFLKDFEDVELRSEPALNLGYESEANQFNLGGRLTDFRYADKSKYDRTVYNLNAQAQRQFTERLQMSIGGGWQKDFSLDTYWDDPLTQKTMIKRDSYNATTGLSYKLTEIDTVDLSFSWSTMEYGKRVPGYSDYDMLSGSIFWQHLLFDGTMAFVAQGNWQKADFDSPRRDSYTLWGGLIPIPAEMKQDITQSTYSGMIGLHWMPSDRFTVQALGGIRYTDSEVKTKTESMIGLEKKTENTYTTGFNGSMSITWRYDSGSIKVSYNQDYLPSAYGELRRASSAVFTGFHNYDQKLSLLYTARYTNSKSDSVTSYKISRDYWFLSAGPRYRFTENFSAMLRYAYTYYHDKITEKKVHSNSVFLQFSLDLPTSF